MHLKAWANHCFCWSIGLSYRLNPWAGWYWFNPLIDNLLSGVDRYELTYDDAFSAYAPVKINILFPSLGLRPRPLGLGDAIGCWHDDWVKGFWVKLNICRGFLTFIWWFPEPTNVWIPGSMKDEMACVIYIVVVPSYLPRKDSYERPTSVLAAASLAQTIIHGTRYRWLFTS